MNSVKQFFIAISIFLCYQSTLTSMYTVFAHGIVDTPTQIKRFQEAIVTDKKHTKAAIFADTEKETGYGINRLISELTALSHKTINRSKMCMGQENDNKVLIETINTVPEGAKIILFGCSRGASTIIKSVSEHNPHNIAAIVLDAGPADMPGTINPMLAKLGIHQSYNQTIFSTLFPAYPKGAVTPLQCIKNIKNKALPILLIHSKNDSKVPYCHSLKLYKTFKDNGFQHVHLLTIPEGRHAFLLQESQVKDAYLAGVHSFYKAHNLPYDSQYAHDAMDQYEPAIVDVERSIYESEDLLDKEYEKNKARNSMILLLGATIATIYLSYTSKYKK